MPDDLGVDSDRWIGVARCREGKAHRDVTAQQIHERTVRPELTGTTGSAQAGNTGSFSSNLVAADLASGSYRLSIYGKGLENDSKYFKATGSSPSSIGIGIKSYAIASPPPVSPVPEPETYAMLLAGLGLMGVIARRRHAKQA